MKKIAQPILVALVCGLGLTDVRASGDARREAAVRGLTEAPLCFEANHGQAGNAARFIARGRDCTVFISATEASLLVEKSGQAQTVHLTLQGANSRAEISGVDELAGRANYFIGADASQWQSDVPLFSRVRIGQVYPGIDVVYYAGPSARLEYDFRLQPGADPKQVSLRISGADKVRLDAEGNLVLKIDGEEIRQHKPVIYQTLNGVRKEITGGYRLAGKTTAGFWVGDYDPSLPLVIDPVVTFSSYLAGKNGDTGWDIAADAVGNIYVCGDTLTPHLATSQAVRKLYGGTRGTLQFGDAFVAKFVPNSTNASLLTLDYLTYLGGLGQDAARGIAADAEGNAYVTGFTDSPNFPTSHAAFKKISGLNNNSQGLYRSDAFVTKINSNGTALVYSTYLGGGERESGNAIAVDSLGCAYVAGFTESLNFPVVIDRTNGATRVVQGAFGGVQDAYVTKLGQAGNVEYSTYLGGAGQDSAQGIAVDTNGNAYVTGYTVSANFPVNPKKNSSLNGLTVGSTSFDAFFTKISANGATNLFSTYLGGKGTDVGMRIAVQDESAYLTGYSYSTNFPVTTNVANTGSGGGGSPDVFVTKFSPTNLTYYTNYSVRFGSRGSDEAFGIAVNAAGEACIAGFAAGTNFFGTNSFTDLRSTNNISATSRDAFVVLLNADASAFTSAVLLRGPGSDEAHGVALDAAGNAYVVGATTSVDFPTVETIKSRPSGKVTRSDVFVGRITLP